MTQTKLSCGGKGPCCHIGYSHRHCEHCDTVISLVQFNWWPNALPTTARPYQPYWGNGTALPPNPSVFAMNSAEMTRTQTIGMLPEGHACEVIP